MPNDERMTNTEARTANGIRGHSSLGLRHSFVIRHSSFVIYHDGPGTVLARTQAGTLPSPRPRRPVMAVSEQTTVLIGVFPDRARAEQYVAELRRAGFTDDQYGVLSPGEEPAHASAVEQDAAAGALTG